MTRKFLFAGALLTATLHVSAARADDTAARAQTLFDQGLAAARANDFKKACPLFRASQDTEPRSGTGINLAVCYEKTYRLASAWAAYREVVGLAQREGNADREEQAKRKIAQLEPQLPRLTITVPSSVRVKGLRVLRDDVEVPQVEWDLPIPVDSGAHKVAVQAPGRWDFQESVNVLQEPRVVTVPPLRERSWWSTGRKIGVPLAATGVAALGTGLVLGLVANGKYNDVVSSNGCTEPNPQGGKLCNPGGDVGSAVQPAYDLAAASTVLTIGGLALAAGGAALIVLTPPRRPAAPARGALPTQLAVRGGPGWMGLSGTFD